MKLAQPPTPKEKFYKTSISIPRKLHRAAVKEASTRYVGFSTVVRIALEQWLNVRG